MMKRKNVLNLRNRDGFNLLETWAREQIAGTGQTTGFRFSSEMPIGFGSTDFSEFPEERKIAVGTHPLKQSVFSGYQPMSDLQFVSIGITMFHELAHFRQHVLPDTPKELLISKISTHQNRQYYMTNWHRLPHEIDAEYTGVMTMWEHLRELSPEHADHLMLEHLTQRAALTEYMLDAPENRFGSEGQIECLFEAHHEDSLDGRRELPFSFLSLDDEIPRILTLDYGVLDRRYEPFYQQLIWAETGEELDRKLGSLVSYLHPELQGRFPTVDFTSLRPENVFWDPNAGDEGRDTKQAGTEGTAG